MLQVSKPGYMHGAMGVSLRNINSFCLYNLILYFATSATQEHVEAATTESGSIEVGYVSNVHGLQGEVRVKPSTDFPELRFSKVK